MAVEFQSYACFGTGERGPSSSRPRWRVRAPSRRAARWVRAPRETPTCPGLESDMPDEPWARGLRRLPCIAGQARTGDPATGGRARRQTDPTVSGAPGALNAFLRWRAVNFAPPLLHSEASFCIYPVPP